MEGGAPVVASGKDAVAARGADGGAGVGVGKDHPVLRELVHDGSLDEPVFGVENLYIPVSEVVG